MNLQRDEVAALLFQQATVLNVTVHHVGDNHTYDLDIDGVRYLACTLSQSSDYYHYRLNLTATHFTALVVGEHNTCVSVPVLALDEGYFYAHREAPRWYNPDEPRTRKNAMVIVGGLLSGVEDAWKQVNDMKRATRYRYLAYMRSYLSLKQGRQLMV